MKNFNPIRFAELMQSQYGNTVIPPNDCSVTAEFPKAEIIEKGISARIPIIIYSPYLSEQIAKLFDTEKVRIGCSCFAKFLLFHYSFKPTFSVMRQELDGLNFNKDFFFELHQGYSTKRIYIKDVDNISPNQVLALQKALGDTYMPYLLLNSKIHEYRTLVNEIIFGRKTVHKHAVLTQIENKNSEHNFQAILKDKNGVLVHRVRVNAYSMANALDILEIQYEGFEIIELKKLNNKKSL